MQASTITLTREQIDFYHREGYLVLPAITSAEEIERLRLIYDWLFASREGREQGDQIAHGSDWRVARSIFVADDEATAQRYALHPQGAYGFYFWNLMTKRRARGQLDTFKHDPALSDAECTLEYVLRNMVIWGNAERVAEQIIDLRRAVGPFGTLLYCGHDWVEPALARRSMELMATEVMPYVNRMLGE